MHSWSCVFNNVTTDDVLLLVVGGREVGGGVGNISDVDGESIGVGELKYNDVFIHSVSCVDSSGRCWVMLCMV